MAEQGRQPQPPAAEGNKVRAMMGTWPTIKMGTTDTPNQLW